MPLYLSQQTLKDAIVRLGMSDAQSSYGDYLVFKRAFKLVRDDASKKETTLPDIVITGTGSAYFLQAHIDLGLRVPAQDVLNGVGEANLTTCMQSLIGSKKREQVVLHHPSLAQPYFIPFGSQRDANRGYRNAKWPSNGPSDTVSRWQSRSSRPLVLVPDTSPKAYKFEQRTKKEFEEFFRKGYAADNSAGKKPLILDAAIWWFRFTDLVEHFSDEPTQEQLTKAFIEDTSLTDTEISGLFSQEVEYLEFLDPTKLSFASEMAKPDDYLPSAPAERAIEVSISTTSDEMIVSSSIPLNFQERVDAIIAYLKAHGFIFDPWQVAAFITAVRTKPFVILAGISGTGKTKLPRLVAEATNSECLTVPVRPDWSDSSDLLGYERLDGTFQPGLLLRFAKRALTTPEKQFFFVLDEMNIARVEYYLAEILSHLEELRPNAEGRMVSGPLMPYASATKDGEEWNQVCLPDNLCIVGSVNMDETTYGFSKKVLDRAFVIEFSTVDLSAVGEFTTESRPELWMSADWRVAATNLAAHPERGTANIRQMIETLIRVNTILQRGQLQFGYRVRDEIVMFCLTAQQCLEAFTTVSTGTVDPLDLAIAMKVLPRIQGGGPTVRRILEDLAAWATPDTSEIADEPGVGENVSFSFCADRIALMLRRLAESGFTNYWM